VIKTHKIQKDGFQEKGLKLKIVTFPETRKNLIPFWLLDFLNFVFIIMFDKCIIILTLRLFYSSNTYELCIIYCYNSKLESLSIMIHDLRSYCVYFYGNY